MKKSKTRMCVAGMLSLLVLWASCDVSFADAPIALQGGSIQIESTEDVLTYSDAASHLNFPMAERFEDGTIWMWYMLGQHLSGWESSMFLWSQDNGATWADPGRYMSGMYILQFPDGKIMQVQARKVTTPSTSQTVDVRTWLNPQSTTYTSVNTPVTFPFACKVYSHRSLIRLPDGKLLHSLYGTVDAETKYSAFVIQSADNGKTWSYLGKIAGSDDPQLADERFEGYCEPVLAVLKDGSLLALLRTGGHMPLMQSKSTDGGATWSTPTQIAENGSVCPTMKVLSNGTLVASSGRPGVYFLVDFTGTGDNWQRIDILAETESSCSNNSIVEYEPNRCLLFYTKSGFSDYQPVPPDGVNRILKATIQVTPATPDTPSITVKSPNGGEVFYGGSSTGIYWTSQGNIPSVVVEYSLDNGATWNTVATVTNIGDYKRTNWRIPNVASTQTLVRVRDAANSAVSDVSNATFKVSGDNDSKNWEGKYECNVLPQNDGWTAFSLGANYTQLNSDGTVTIDTKTTGGSIAAGWKKAITGLDFTKGGSIEIRCRTRYSDWFGSAIVDFNDATNQASMGFETKTQLPAGGVFVNGGTAWPSGGWYNTNVKDNYRIYRLTAISGTSGVKLYIDGVETTRTGNIIARGLGAANEVWFGDVSGTNNTMMDIDYIRWTTKGAFPAPQKAISLMAPNGGQLFKPSDSCTIKWETYATMANVVLEYTVDNGTTWKPIATVANSGSYVWTIPTEDSFTCRVRVRNSDDASMADMSSQAFAITATDMGKSRNWEGKYEADVLPNLAGFTPWSMATSYTSVSSGVVTVGTYDFNVAGAWNRSDANFNFDNGATIEIRARILAGQHRDAASLSIEDLSSGKMAKFGLEINGPVSLGKVGGIYTEGYGWSWMDVQPWHVYRLTVRNGGGNPVQVYVDGEPLPFTAGYAANTFGKGIYFGDMSSTNDATYEIDYIRWTNKGSFVPSTAPDRIAGDANEDGMVDVGDLGILAANYGGSGKTWNQGDFNGDGLVDVGDLGILAANYGTGVNGTVDFSADYAKAFGTTAEEDAEDDSAAGSICSALGLPLVAGLLLAGLALMAGSKLED